MDYLPPTGVLEINRVGLFSFVNFYILHPFTHRLSNV